MSSAAAVLVAGAAVVGRIGRVTEYCSALVVASLSSDGSLVVVAGGEAAGACRIAEARTDRRIGPTDAICACAAGPASISLIEATAATARLVNAFRI